jgi:N-acyl-D-amino-acid deacylase
MTLAIRNALLFDGTGGEPTVGEVLIEGDRIGAVGSVGPAGMEIDGTGLAVAPGFIDVHTHDDFAALVHRDMTFKSRGGVTTCIVGNCGFGAAPWDAASVMAKSIHPDAEMPRYEGYAGYLAALDANPPGVNIGVLAGHGTIRMATMGTERRAPTDNEMAAMHEIVAEALDAGVLGLSTGLIYEPGRHAQTDEIIELTSALQGTTALYASHMRNEAEGLLDAVREAIRVGAEAGVPVQISHHKATGKENWGLVTESLALIDEARARGQIVNADQYPYTAGSTMLRAVMQNKMFDDHDGAAGVVVSACAARPEWEGRSIADLAIEWGLSPMEAAHRVVDEDGSTFAVIHSMCEPDVETVMAHPSTMVGSDGLPTLDARPHPRLYNTFARVLGHYSRERGVLSMAEAVHRMTGYSADTFGLVDRGYLRRGAFADLVLFDPAIVIDQGTFEDPNQYPIGIQRVFVNGVEVVHDDVPTGARPGRALRRVDS